MKGIHVTSEIKPLKKVLLHRPGNELLNLTPDTLSRLLFDDIPYLPDAIKEHEEFVTILRSNGVEVVFLEDLMADIAATKDYNIIRSHNEKLISDFENQLPVNLLPKFKNVIVAISEESVFMQTEIFNRAKR